MPTHYVMHAVIDFYITVFLLLFLEFEVTNQSARLQADRYAHNHILYIDIFSSP